MTIAELQKLVKEARAKVAEGSFMVRRAQERIDKFKAKYEKAREQRDTFREAGNARKERFWQRRMGRNKRKVHFWTTREADAIESKRDRRAALARRLRKLAAAQPNAAKIVATANKYVGVAEGSALQRKWANDLGYSAALPWCSIFAANMMLEAAAITKAQLPPNPPYSGAWMNWSHGHRVSRDQVRPGDLVIFDWGDGGITDHVAIYAGSGQKIGGNENDRVERDAVPWGNAVAVIRPE